MKVIVEFDIAPSQDNPNVLLHPELVTLRLKRRLQNADIVELKLDYTAPGGDAPVAFIATLKHFYAVEPL